MFAMVSWVCVWMCIMFGGEKAMLSATERVEYNEILQEYINFIKQPQKKIIEWEKLNENLKGKKVSPKYAILYRCNVGLAEVYFHCTPEIRNITIVVMIETQNNGGIPFSEMLVETFNHTNCGCENK